MRADARESLASLQGVAAGVLRLEARLESLSSAISAAAPAAASAGSAGARAEKRSQAASSWRQSGSRLRMGGGSAVDLGKLRSDVEKIEGLESLDGTVGVQDLVRVMGSADEKLDDISKRLQNMEEKVRSSSSAQVIGGEYKRLSCFKVQGHMPAAPA